MVVQKLPPCLSVLEGVSLDGVNVYGPGEENMFCLHAADCLQKEVQQTIQQQAEELEILKVIKHFSL